MSDVTATAVPTVNVSATDATLQPATAQAPQNTPAAPSDDPAWVAPRLERDRAKFLKDLGVENADELKELVAQSKATKEAAKSDAQKRGELEETLKTERARITEMGEALGALAKGQMASLTDAQRNAVSGIAGDDPGKQIKTIEALRSTWSTPAAATAATEEKPRQTAVAPNAPASVNTTPQPVDPKEIWKELKEINPVAAARYAIENGIFNK